MLQMFNLIHRRVLFQIWYQKREGVHGSEPRDHDLVRRESGGSATAARTVWGCVRQVVQLQIHG